MHSGAIFGAMYMFTLATQKWTSRTAIPIDVYNANAVALADKNTILFCGGFMTNNCFAFTRVLFTIESNVEGNCLDTITLLCAQWADRTHETVHPT
jgi:hypothetical protein